MIQVAGRRPLRQYFSNKPSKFNELLGFLLPSISKVPALVTAQSSIGSLVVNKLIDAPVEAAQRLGS